MICLSSYESGSICLFYSAYLYHKVDHWTPVAQTLAQQAQNITPGRIGSVFFFPQASFEILENKPPEWGQKTGFGKYEKFLTPGMLAKPEEWVSEKEKGEEEEEEEDEEEEDEEEDEEMVVGSDMDTSN